jgi:hypothetical protein
MPQDASRIHTDGDAIHGDELTESACQIDRLENGVQSS